MSEGNGHPYSWSAICNGYEPVAMEQCGFPAIPRYLEKQLFPNDALPDVRVTHVWTQDTSVSHHIARAALIEHVVEQPTEMIGAVDGILLARDDALAHVELATPFLQAGIPIYIDKPLALSRRDGNRLLSLQSYPGQIFTCSALRYARELQLTPQIADQVGRVRMIHGVAPKYWETYAVHVIEPLLLMAPDRGVVTDFHVRRAGESVTLLLEFGSGMQGQITTTGSVAAPIGLRVFGERGWRDMVFHDAFAAFKAALGEFVKGIRTRRPMIASDFMLEVVDLIELGRRGATQ